MKMIDKLTSVLRQFKQGAAVKDITRHNREMFPARTSDRSNRKVVLFEFNAMHSAQIAYSYLANILADKNGAEIKAYLPRVHGSFLKRFLFFLRKLLRRNEFAVYQSFGASEIFAISPSNSQKEKAAELLMDVAPRLTDLRALEDLTVDGVWIGDLIYDTYLMGFKKPTIAIESEEFQKFLNSSLELFVFWQDYFDSHEVEAVNVSHCVYNLAMPLRIAVKRGIPAYQANLTHVYRLRPEKLFAYNEFFEYREQFEALPADVREKGLAEAKVRIERRFSGEVGVDMGYSTKSAYGESKHQQLLRESPRKKILIATHCFFDSPHSYGNNLFPDFYEWLEFLGGMTESTDYDWYIKTHPDYLPGTMEIIEQFVARFPKFTILPADASHHQIIEEGIDVALTVYGTIGFEYAALGVPVINASLNNPHIVYKFNQHPASVEEYRDLLIRLDDLEHEIDRSEVYEYYYMRHIHDTDDLFFTSYEKMMNDLGGYNAQFGDGVYQAWIQECSSEKHEALCEGMRYFVESGDFRMRQTHIQEALKGDTETSGVIGEGTEAVASKIGG